MIVINDNSQIIAYLISLSTALIVFLSKEPLRYDNFNYHHHASAQHLTHLKMPHPKKAAR